MGKPKNKIRIEWSSNFAYAIGLLTTDGCLSSDKRHFDFTSKDLEQILNFMKCLGIENKIGFKISGSSKKKQARIQFGDINFYNFLLKIGLMPRKSKVLYKIKIPDRFFFDFLRGHLDGDGTFYSYWDKRWKSSFMFYLVFASASEKHIYWIREKLSKLLNIRGHITKSSKHSTYQLKYAKEESIKLFKKIYYSKVDIFLKRKYLKINRALAIVGLCL